jgi:uncharacterized RDD family membrane protein YckC
MTLVAATAAEEQTGYAGLATRTLAFAADALIINAIAWFVGVIIALGLSLVEIPDDVRAILLAIGAGAALLWSAAYFAFFWSANGQTPGDRLLGIRVEDAAHARPISTRRALVRVLVLPLSFIPLCAGILLILVDGRRRALHDWLTRTVVVYAPEEPPVVHPSSRPIPRPRATASERHDTSSLR